MTQKTPSTDEVREIAIEIGRECIANGTRPSYSEVARRMGRHTRWLTHNPTDKLERLRLMCSREWMMMGTLPPAAMSQDSPPPPMPDEYPVGDDLYGILNHPDRLRMFCDLARSARIEGAMWYVKWRYKDFYAP
jgi:hypothetical protein